MFGKTKELTDIADLTDEPIAADIAIDDFFGDEAAVEEAVRFDALRQRVGSVEQQIQSQFTSMAAYAQIAQEQVELVRSESQHAIERSEQKLVGLIERERTDRLSGSAGNASAGGVSPDVTARLDALDAQVADIRANLQQCLSNQKALAEAITELFAHPIAAPVEPAPVEPAPPAPVSTEVTNDGLDVFAAPDIATVEPMPQPPAPIADEPTFDSLDGPIAELSLD